MVTYMPDDVGSDTTSHYTDIVYSPNMDESLTATIEAMRS